MTLAAILLSMCASIAAGADAVNSDNPGEEVDVKKYLQAGKTNIIDFYSDYCGPCRKISPFLVKLDERREDIVVIKIDINRRGVKRIDWGSPLAKQYKLRSIPHFQVYDGQGKLTSEGREAFAKIVDILTKEGIIGR